MPLTEAEALSQAAQIFNQPAEPASPPPTDNGPDAVAEAEPSEASSPEESETEVAGPEKEEASEESSEESGEEQRAAGGEEGEEPAPEEESAKEETPELTRLYKENPNLKSFLKKNPDLRAAWFKASQVLSEFPTVEDAKAAREALVEINALDKLFLSPNIADKKELLKRFAESSIDPATGKSTGHYEALVGAMADDLTSALMRATRSGQFKPPAGWQPEHLLAALAGLRAALGLPVTGDAAGEAFSGQPTPVGDETVRQRLSAIEQRERELAGKSEQLFSEAIQSRYSDWVGRKIASLIDGSSGLKAQPPGFQKYVQNEIIGALHKAMEADQIFSSQFDAKARSGDRSPEHIAELAEMLKSRAEHYLPAVVKKVFREVGAEIERKEAAEEQRRAAVPKRKEAALSSSAAKLSRPGAGRTGRPTMNPGESPDAYARRIVSDAMREAGV